VLSNEYYSQELHGPYQLFDLGDFGLEDGGKIRSCKLAYATFGQLSPQKDKAILILTLVLEYQQDYGTGLHRAGTSHRSC
jgi:homoserine O-acetyltransferase